MRNNSRWDAETKWTIALHPDAPFGVVRVVSDLVANEITDDNRVKIVMSDVLTLTQVGNDAKSALPQTQETQTPSEAAKE